MGLPEDVQRLLETLQSVAARLGAFRGSPVQKEYAEHLQRRLVPLVGDLRSLIDERADYSEVLRAMAEIKSVMCEVNGAATKGEMNIFPDGLLNRFWQLSTIFQEQRYRDERL
jgi:hypothetical protein